MKENKRIRKNGGVVTDLVFLSISNAASLAKNVKQFE